MEKSRRLWVLALVLGIGGCAGEDSGSPAAGTAGAGGPPNPALNKVDPSGWPGGRRLGHCSGKGHTGRPGPVEG